MFIAAHAAAGALIGQTIQEGPALIFFLSFTSHFLLDLIPHGDHHHVVDYYFGKKEKLRAIYNTLVVDSIATVILVVIFMMYTHLNKVAIAWGIIGSVLPDLLVGLNELVTSSKTKWFTNLHFRFHNALVHRINVKPLTGTVAQIFIIAALLVAL